MEPLEDLKSQFSDLKLPGSRRGRWRLLAAGSLFEASLAGVAWILGLLLEQPPLQEFSWSWTDVAVGGLGTFPLLLAFALCWRSRWYAIVRIKITLELLFRPFVTRAGIFGLALISACAGMGEEMLFRGVIQAALARWNYGAGLVLASVLFGLVHPLSLLYILIVTLVGMYLGLLWLWTGNLLVVMVTHGLYDLLVLMYLRYRWQRHPPLATLPNDMGIPTHA